MNSSIEPVNKSYALAVPDKNIFSEPTKDQGLPGQVSVFAKARGGTKPFADHLKTARGRPGENSLMSELDETSRLDASQGKSA